MLIGVIRCSSHWMCNGHWGTYGYIYMDCYTYGVLLTVTSIVIYDRGRGSVIGLAERYLILILTGCSIYRWHFVRLKASPKQNLMILHKILK